MSSRLLTAAFAVCLFLIIVSSKWATFERYGSPMPDWDQWDAEAGEALVPWYTHDQFFKHLFNPHNEHRVVLTKLQNLTLTVVNGQWDSRVEAVANALLHAAIAAGLWILGRRRLAAFWQAPYFLLLAALFAPPVAWQNVLGGFHSQQYWLVGLSFVAIVTLPFSPTWSKPWWLGAFTAILVLGSMGSGLLAAAVSMVVVAWRWRRAELGRRDIAPTLALGAILVAVGLLTRASVEWHESMKAKSVHDFVFSIVHSLQWPWRDRDWAAALFWFPWLVVAWRTLRSKSTPAAGSTALDPFAGRFSATLTALGGWVLLQVAATAYARGAGADYPASRYMDTLTFGAAVNGLALAWLLTNFARRRVPQLAFGVLGLAWAVTLGLGLRWQLGGTYDIELPEAKRYYLQAEANMRRYLSTNDPKHLASPDIPYPSAQGIIDRLAEPTLRALMPVPLRTPLSLEPHPSSSAAFTPNDARNLNPDAAPRHGLAPTTPPLDSTISWGTYDPVQGIAATGEWRSRPVTLTGKRGWLRFETAGHPGERGVALEVRDAATGELLETVRPTNTPGDTWRPVYVRAPDAPFVVVARDQDPARWLAFGGPIEMGPLSHFARMATKHSLTLLYVSAGSAALLALLAAVMARRRLAGSQPL